MENIEKRELDEFNYFEILDRLSNINIMINSLVLDHPVLEKHRDFEILVIYGSEKLEEAYQQAGELLNNYLKQKEKK